MNEKLQKMLEAHGVDIAVGSIDYWSSAIEMVFAEMHDEVAAAEREACAALCDEWFAATAGQAIRERGKPDPSFKNYMGDNWAGIV